MAFPTLTLNLDFNLWRQADNPLTDPPTYTSVPCQKYMPSRVLEPLVNPQYQIRFDVDMAKTFIAGDKMECPAGSGRYFRTLVYHWQHEGFPNEYWLAMAIPWIPPAGPDNPDLP